MKIKLQPAINRMAFEIDGGNGATINAVLEQKGKSTKVSLAVWRSAGTVSKMSPPVQSDMILSANLGDDFEIAISVAENIIEQLLGIWG